MDNVKVETLTKKKQLVEKSRYLEVSYKIFYEFYANLLQDYHASEFFLSHYTVDELVRKQSEALYVILNDIQQNNIVHATKALETIAQRHWLLGVNHRVMFEAVELYIKLLRDFKEELNLEETTILTVKELLEQTTAKEYIKGTLQSIFDFLVNGKTLKFYSRYDEFFERELFLKLGNMLSVFDDACQHCSVDDRNNFSCNTVSLMGSHIECMTGKLFHGLGFDIMTYGNDRLKTETIAEHKLVHSYMNQLIKYYQSKEYSKAISITSAFTNSIYKMVYNYQLVSKHWEDNKEKLLSEILNSKRYQNKAMVMIITSCNETSRLYCNYITDMLEDIFVKHMDNFDFLYFTKLKGTLYVFMNKDCALYRQKYESIMADIETLAEKLANENLEIEQKTVFRICKFDIDDLVEIDKEEVEEMLNILKEESKAKAKEKGSPVVVVNVSERKYELLQKVREEINIKKIVLEKVASKDIDIFIQWIYDINLNKKFFEILARAKSGDEYIPAYKFINILQREHKMIDLDIAVITNVIKNIDKIKALTDEFYMNIYPLSLSNENVVNLLKELIILCNEREITLNLELTEYAITTQREIIDELSHNMFYLAFDDFGTGYTNYELVGELVDTGIAKTLKVDGYIVKRLLESDVYASIVESITIFSKRIGLRIIYEFVDSENIITALKDIAKTTGFPENRMFLQGFYLHKPDSLEKEYEDFVAGIQVDKID